MNLPRAHAVLSASGSDRWINCTPSARIEDGMPESHSVYADEGTFGHSMVDECVLNELKADHLCGVPLWESSEFFTQEMRDAAQVCIDHANTLISDARKGTSDALVLVEQRLDYSMYVPEGFGRGDLVVIGDRKAWFRDWKFGRGKLVRAANNSQLNLYGLAVVEQYADYYGLETVNLGIVQPRIDHYDEVELTVDELRAWGESIRPRAQLAWEGKGEFVTGAWCGFCKIKATCRARAEQNLVLAKEVFRPVAELTLDEIAEFLPKLDSMQSWASDVQAFALKQAVDGVTVPGWKLVNGRSVRKIENPVELSRRLLDAGYEESKIYEHSLLSLTALEKVVGKKFAELSDGLIVKPAGKPVLVPCSDKRTEFSPAETAFTPV